MSAVVVGANAMIAWSRLSSLIPNLRFVKSIISSHASLDAIRDTAELADQWTEKDPDVRLKRRSGAETAGAEDGRERDSGRQSHGAGYSFPVRPTDRLVRDRDGVPSGRPVRVFVAAVMMAVIGGGDGAETGLCSRTPVPSIAHYFPARQ